VTFLMQLAGDRRDVQSLEALPQDCQRFTFTRHSLTWSEMWAGKFNKFKSENKVDQSS